MTLSKYIERLLNGAGAVALTCWLFKWIGFSDHSIIVGAITAGTFTLIDTTLNFVKGKTFFVFGYEITFYEEKP